MNGTLALTGSGEYLPGMRPVDQKLLARLKSKTPKVVCLPTGAGTEGPERIRYWSDLGVNHFKGLGADAEAVRVIDRSTAEDETLAAKIRAADLVYLSGGKPDYLHNTLVDTPAFAAIESVLAKGGVVAGCSAGAMIWGARSSPLPWHDGFDYLPGAVILPHFDEMRGWMVDIIKTVLASNMTILGIEGYTALVCSDSIYSVSGSGGVTVWDNANKHRYTDGETLDWKPAK
jgi:cyanophycinase-like exopeptidase